MPAFVVGGLLFAAVAVAFGLVFSSISGGPPSWPFFVVAIGVLVVFWSIARRIWRAAHPRFARDIEVSVDGQELRRGDHVGVTVSGEGELEVGLVCTEVYDVLRRAAGSDTQSRYTYSESVWQSWAPAPHAALGQRIELTIPVDGPYSYEGDCVSLTWAVVARRVGSKRLAVPTPVWVAP